MSMSINPVDLAAAAEGILNTQYLLQRERLLSASAQASRLLLEAPDAMKAMPEVLRLLGEAAQVYGIDTHGHGLYSWKALISLPQLGWGPASQPPPSDL